MEHTHGSRGARQVRVYEIRIDGHLDARWTEWLEGASLTHTEDGTTVLIGPIADQTALHGVLARLRDLGVTLISVNERNGDGPVVR